MNSANGFSLMVPLKPRYTFNSNNANFLEINQQLVALCHFLESSHTPIFEVF